MYLDKALLCAQKIKNNQIFYIDNVICEKAFALFDIQQYRAAANLMQRIKNNGFRNINISNQSFLIMQMGYLFYLDKNYKLAEAEYDEAITKMRQSSPCDLPIIYGKKIALYGAMGETEKMKLCYQWSKYYADSCGILKYNLYAAEMMRNTYKNTLKNYEKGYRYFDVYDSLNTIYNADVNKNKLQELEVKYETTKKEQALAIQEQKLTANKRLIGWLFTSIAGLILLVALIVTIQQRKKSLTEKINTQRFTKQLLDKTEEERKRIATDLHDSVNNELLLIKASANTNPSEVKAKIDSLINHVRVISRNLHPVLFEDLGLQDSVEQLAERVQEHNQFILNTEIEYDQSLTVSDELQLYRIIQEAVNNIIKYSNAVAGFISIKEYDSKIVVEIKDNGNGFDVEKTLLSKEAFGLHNIIERALAINGNAKIISDKTGTIIHIEIKKNKCQQH